MGQELRECNETPVIMKKANSIIQAVGNPTLLANKIMLLALIKVKENNGCDKIRREYFERLRKQAFADFSKGLVAEIDNAELKSIISDNSGSYYKRVSEIMDMGSERSLSKQWGIVINDKKSGIVGFVSVITAMVYDKECGKLFIKFSDETAIKNLILDLKRGYTSLDVKTMMSFKSVYAYRLYEILLSSIGLDDYKAGTPKNSYIFSFGVSELRFKLGSFDSLSNSDMRSALSDATTAADYEEIEKRFSPTGKVGRYQNFDVTLQRAVKEINELPGQRYLFSYQPKRSGIGGRITDIVFTVERPTVENIHAESLEVKLDLETLDFIDEIRGIIKEPLKSKELSDIAKAADYDIEKIKAAYELAEKSTAPINNLVGFLKAAIVNGYEASVEKKNKKCCSGYSQAHRDRQGIMREEGKDIDEWLRQRVLENLT